MKKFNDYYKSKLNEMYDDLSPKSNFYPNELENFLAVVEESINNIKESMDEGEEKAKRTSLFLADYLGRTLNDLQNWTTS